MNSLVEAESYMRNSHNTAEYSHTEGSKYIRAMLSKYGTQVAYQIIKAEFEFRDEKILIEDQESELYDWNDDEKIIKRIANFVCSPENSKFISATDISSYTFCPISYCIKKSFAEDEIEEETQIGIDFHEQSRLVTYTDYNDIGFELSHNVNLARLDSYQNKDFFNDVRSSKISYVGHNSEEDRKYFTSSKPGFIGKPDYIFVNRNGENFIVEEKFRNLTKESKYLNKNHRLQLSSYIIGLDELRAAYGYLIYWYYTHNGPNYMAKCIVFKISRSDIDREELRAIYKTILKLNNGFTIDFNNNELEANKCVGCAVRKFCGHKTGRRSSISIPYGKFYYGLA